MGRRATTGSTKSKIVDAAWKLFYEHGYDNTTVDDIVAESGTSKGSFYHYFDGKDALLGSLAYLFDQKYEELSHTFDENENTIDVLYKLNREIFEMIENQIDLKLLSRLYSTQLTTKGEKQLLDRNRVYYRLLRKLVIDGQQKGEITTKRTVNEIVRLYALTERALLYDWCLCEGEFPLKDYGQSVMNVILESLRAK